MVESDGLPDDVAALIADEAISWRSLDDATILITGASGLVGASLVRALIARRAVCGGSLKLLLPLRDPGKAQALFGDYPFIDARPWSAGDPLPASWMPEYLIHGASPTTSRFFVDSPVETIATIIDGARGVLEFARIRPIRKLVFLSTMEVYGEASGPVGETTLGALDPLIARNSYPEAKRAAESLCSAYAAEYGVPAVIARLAQTFGAGVAFDDSRVFAQFGRSLLRRENITLATDGSKRSMYVSLGDAVRAILVLLGAGEPGRAYNVANEATYCSIREMAQAVCQRFGDPSLSVEISADEGGTAGIYRKSSDLALDATRLRALGWRPRDDLMTMYRQMLDRWIEDERSADALR